MCHHEPIAIEPLKTHDDWRKQGTVEQKLTGIKEVPQRRTRVDH